MKAIEISWFNLILAYILLLIPLILFYYYKTKLVLSTILSFARMTIQLLLVGSYLKYIFQHDSILLNILWLLLITLATAGSITKRSQIKFKYFFLPLFIGVVSGLLYSYMFSIYFILKVDNPFQAFYLIPIAGMILGNSLTTSIIAIRTYFHSLKKNKLEYRFYLSCGAKKEEALFSFIKHSFQEAFEPFISRTSAVGFIALPGMMTGQILGNGNPVEAIKYQILIMILIFSSIVITLFISLFLSKFFIFDDYDNFMDKKVLK